MLPTALRSIQASHMYYLPMPASIPRPLRTAPVAGVAYALLWLTLGLINPPTWMLAFGLQFGALLLAPLRYWAWLLGLQFLALVLVQTGALGVHGPAGLSLIEAAHALVVAALLLALRQRYMRVSLETPDAVIRLLLAGLLVALCIAVLDAAVLVTTHHGRLAAQARDAVVLQLLGDYIGILLVAPVMILLLRERPDRALLKPLMRDGLLVMLPTMVILWVLAAHPDPQPRVARVLALAPVMFFAFRHGWRGANLALLITSVGMAAADAAAGRLTSVAVDDLFMAVVGTAALLLGSATDALRHSCARVAEQNAHLAAANQQLAQLARQLGDAARRTLDMDERRRHHMAAELHDELGQNLAAIQTRVKLAQARLDQAGLTDVAEAINQILGHMRRALHRLLNDLRPAVLDEFGLLRALDEGPIRDLLDNARMRYHTQFSGNPRLLDENIRVAIYRLVQESATNAVRHAQAREFRLRLRVGERNATVLALLDIRDDGIGFDGPAAREGRGLQGMRDRVTSLGGVFRVRSGRRGVRLRVLLKNKAACAQA